MEVQIQNNAVQPQLIKRYNKPLAFIFAYAWEFGLAMLLCSTAEEAGRASGAFLAIGVVSLIIAVLLVALIGRRTPKGKLFATCIRCWWLGVKVSFKISLFCGIFTIPLAVLWNIKYNRNDYTAIVNGKKICAVQNEDGSFTDKEGNNYPAQ